MDHRLASPRLCSQRFGCRKKNRRCGEEKKNKKKEIRATQAGAFVRSILFPIGPPPFPISVGLVFYPSALFVQSKFQSVRKQPQIGPQATPAKEVFPIYNVCDRRRPSQIDSVTGATAQRPSKLRSDKGLLTRISRSRPVCPAQGPKSV
ncbi:hypothetical protein M0R45_006970 [Rubus argutus]|uniref:Uncharacterized protein n=1 Tax=Rubus argutus TaxID=59490 RepID=A0AAW1YSS3_RUBAR